MRRANSSKLGRSSPTSNSHTQGSGETASIFPCQFLLCFWTQASSSSGGRSLQKALQVPTGFPQKPRLNPLHISYLCSCCSTPSNPPTWLCSHLGYPAPLTLSDTPRFPPLLLSLAVFCHSSTVSPCSTCPPSPHNALIHSGDALPFCTFADDSLFLKQ